MGQFNIFFFILDELFEKIQFETWSNLFFHITQKVYWRKEQSDTF